MSAVLAGTGTLTRLALRRDRLVIPVWALVTGGLVASGVGSLEGLYGTAAERAEVAASMTANSSMRALYGPVFDDSLGGLVAWRFGTFAAVLAAVASLIVVVRHTREEEETGRQEMLSAGAVGRRAPLTAALLAALTVNAAVALIVTAGLAGQGAAGALALGLAIGGTGMVFATTAALAAQLTESARLAKGLTGGAVGLAFVLRAAGDSGSADGSSVLTWLSPIGWAENVRAFAGERWWVLLLIAAAVLVQTAAAYALTGRRDVGASCCTPWTAWGRARRCSPRCCGAGSPRSSSTSGCTTGRRPCCSRWGRYGAPRPCRRSCGSCAARRRTGATGCGRPLCGPSRPSARPPRPPYRT